ncbi:hypothetical protein Acr_19g0005250 [Actinidia rufa]|uniref:Apple domain-containing protein n=1 Tax=Actinidia rufa TaxID=165716 RepID=A0A7J0GA63_9ERIC|nr:hypothetical protein Acr_19g0005250 [Actinidia rufa]
MDQSQSPCCAIFLTLSFLICCPIWIHAQSLYEQPISNPPTTWTNNFSAPLRDIELHEVLVAGQKLISNKSSTDWGEGLYALFLSNTKLVASMESDPPQHYYESNIEFEIPTDKTGRAYIRFEHGSFGGYNLSLAVKAQFMSLEADGHVRLYEWRRSDWEKASDLLSLFVGGCVYPMVCGNYGICSDEGQCSCPDQEDKTRTRYFKQKFERQPDLGCSLMRPISCEFPQFHSLVELKDISYSSFSTSTFVGETSLDYCKNTCLKTCSCKAVVFQKSLWNSSTGNCYLLPEVLSFTDSRTANMTIAYVKFQNPPKMETKSAAIALGTSLGALFGSDFKKRPSMAVVIQALEGVVNIEHNLDYNLTDQQVPRRTIAAMEDNQDVAGDVTLLMPSVLSGPRS